MVKEIKRLTQLVELCNGLGLTRLEGELSVIISTQLTIYRIATEEDDSCDRNYLEKLFCLPSVGYIYFIDDRITENTTIYHCKHILQYL